MVENFEIVWSIQLLASIAFLVIFTSILGVSALYVLLRHGEATRVTGMMYLPPVIAVLLELAMFGLVPSGLTLAGIAIACAGVAMAVWSGRWKSSTSSR
jgi:drug/metabolite transporter (DMT)-like permease